MKQTFFHIAAALCAFWLLGTILQDKNFVHLSLTVGNIPFYITELLIFLSIIFLALSGRLEVPRLHAKGLLVLLAITFFFSMLRGFLIYGLQQPVRDGMILGYAVVVWIAYCWRVHAMNLSSSFRKALFVLLIVALAARYIVHMGNLLFKWDIPLQPASTAMYLSAVLIALRVFWGEQLKLITSLQVLIIALLIILSVRTAWLCWAIILIATLFLNRWKLLFPRWASFVFRLVPVGLVVGLALAYSNPVELFYPTLADLRSMVAPTPKLAGYTWGSVRTRYWMWQDALAEVVTAAPPPNDAAAYKVRHDEKGKAIMGPYIPDGGLPRVVDKPAGVIANPELQRRADADPLTSKTAVITSNNEKMAVDITRHPGVTLMFGYPMGKPFIPERVKNWMDEKRFDPHNSFIAILYRTGCVGLGSFIVWILLLLRNVWGRLSNTPQTIHEPLMTSAFLFILYLLIHMQTDVLLESPYKGVYFWIAIGLLLPTPQRGIR